MVWGRISYVKFISCTFPFKHGVWSRTYFIQYCNGCLFWDKYSRQLLTFVKNFLDLKCIFTFILWLLIVWRLSCFYAVLRGCMHHIICRGNPRYVSWSSTQLKLRKSPNSNKLSLTKCKMKSKNCETACMLSQISMEGYIKFLLRNHLEDI